MFKVNLNLDFFGDSSWRDHKKRNSVDALLQYMKWVSLPASIGNVYVLEETNGEMVVYPDDQKQSDMLATFSGNGEVLIEEEDDLLTFLSLSFGYYYQNVNDPDASTNVLSEYEFFEVEFRGEALHVSFRRPPRGPDDTALSPPLRSDAVVWVMEGVVFLPVKSGI